ncbi:MAG: hypothetical protein N3F10_05235 [Candidatus Bathyarchaeota archaeon]|nr:hypothetical protein [Candidatus Bathyarchaeota archaeon]
MIKAADEDEIIAASQELTKAYIKNPSLRTKIYTGLKTNLPSSFYKNSFGDFGYKSESEEVKDKAALELIEAIQASEAVLHTPNKNGEASFGYNPVSDKLYCILSYLDRKRFPEITIELNKKPAEAKPNFFKKHKKALLGATAAIAFGSCIAYPSIVKGELSFDPALTLNHAIKLINTYPILSRNLSYFPYLIPAFRTDNTEQKISHKRKIFKYGIPIALAGAWFSLDLLNQDITIPFLNIKISGPINTIKAGIYSGSGMEWNKSIDLALLTNTWNFLEENQKVINIYKRLEGNKDLNVYQLLKFFLKDCRISLEENSSLEYYLRVRDNLIPKELLPYWPIEERGYLACRFCEQLLSDGKITDEEKHIAELMLNFRKPITTVRGIQKEIILDIYKDHDNDGFNTMEELLKGKNYLNPLETPNTNDSEVYAIYLAGGEGYGREQPYIFNHLAIKYGIPKDHVKILLGYSRYQYDGINPETGQPYLSMNRKYFFPELKGNLVKDYPKLDNIQRNVKPEDVINEIKKLLQIADKNDVVYIHNSSEGPGFNIVVKPSPDPKEAYEMINPSKINEILAVPNRAKVIVVNDACGAEFYIKGMVGYGPHIVKEVLEDCVGIAAVRVDEKSYGTFEYKFLSRLRDGYSIRCAVPTEVNLLEPFKDDPYYKEHPEEFAKKITHPVIWLGRGDYSWIDYYNLFS